VRGKEFACTKRAKKKLSKKLIVVVVELLPMVACRHGENLELATHPSALVTTPDRNDLRIELQVFVKPV
jgi:hypothetical protein